jgi:hypothetical protein
LADPSTASLHEQMHVDAASLAWTVAGGHEAAAAPILHEMVLRFHRMAIALARTRPEASR